MIVVTGNAPRSGTSAMMRALLEHYKPHSYAEKFPAYVAKDLNPEGYWDIKKEYVVSEDPIPTEENTVIKLWAPMFHRVNTQDVKLFVFMQRNNFLEQVDSIERCAIAEGFTMSSQEIAAVFTRQREYAADIFANTNTLVVDMENFREDPDLFIDHIMEVVPCQ